MREVTTWVGRSKPPVTTVNVSLYAGCGFGVSSSVTHRPAGDTATWRIRFAVRYSDRVYRPSAVLAISPCPSLLAATTNGPPGTTVTVTGAEVAASCRPRAATRARYGQAPTPGLGPV